MSSGTCYNCGSSSHKQFSCPKPKRVSSTCHKCGDVGHKQSDCPKARFQPNPDASIPSSSSSSTVCFYCDKMGHFREHCPLKEEEKKKEEKEIAPVSSTSSSASKCITCVTNPADCLFIPCMHVSMCLPCAENMMTAHDKTECPHCREPITKATKIFLSGAED